MKEEALPGDRTTSVVAAAPGLKQQGGGRQGGNRGALGAACSSAFTKSDVVLDWMRTDPDLALAGAEDRSRTTAQTSSHRWHLTRDQLYKIGLAESELAARALSGKGKGKSATDPCCQPDEADRLRETATDQGCHDPWEAVR